jgi:hypothetical protein
MPRNAASPSRRSIPQAHRRRAATAPFDEHPDARPHAPEQQIHAVRTQGDIQDPHLVDPIGKRGRSTSTSPRRPSTCTPRHACNSMKGAPAAQACGMHATG